MSYHVTFTPPQGAEEAPSAQYQVTPASDGEPADEPNVSRCWAGPVSERTAGATGSAEPLRVELELLRFNPPPAPSVVRVNGQIRRLTLTRGPAGLRLRLGRQQAEVCVESELSSRLSQTKPSGNASNVSVRSPLPGRVLAVGVSVGDEASQGASLLTIEAMKMENEILAPATGRVVGVHVAEGDTVDADAALVEIAPD